MNVIRLTIIAAMLICGPSAIAQTDRPPTRAEQSASDLAKLSKPPHPSCRAWNDGCVACTSDDGKLASCTDITVPGSCIAHTIVCTRREGERRE